MKLFHIHVNCFVMSPKTFKKVMRDNSSEFPSMHAHALERLEELNHPLIPKLYYYDDVEYECEFIEGLELEDHIRQTGNYQLGLDVMNLCHDLIYKMSHVQFNHKFPYSHGLNWRLSAEDIHSRNILISAKDEKPYLVDLDQIGWWHPFTVFKIMESATSRLTESMRYQLIFWSNDLSTEEIITEARKEINEMSKKLKFNFEAGVRHGFWNVKTKEEIKEKYEKYKHLESWYAKES